VTATRQCFELGARRKLIEVPGLVPEQDEVSRAEGDSDWSVDRSCGQELPRSGGLQDRVEARTGAYRVDGRSRIVRG
jgi:hypothetical protein